MITGDTIGGPGGNRGDSVQHGAMGTTDGGHAGTVGAQTGAHTAPTGATGRPWAIERTARAQKAHRINRVNE
jgi:hypothetical protein